VENALEMVPDASPLRYTPGRFGPEGGARLINAYVEQLAEDAKAGFVA
jgi:hypothetical protein